MRRSSRPSLIMLTLVAGIDILIAATGAATAQSSQPGSAPQSSQATAPGSQQEKFNLSPSKEQSVTQGLANQSAQNVPGFSGQVGNKLPASEKAQPLPGNVQAQVPEIKQMLFVKLPDRIVLIDPDTELVAEIVMAPATTGSSPGSTSPGSSPSAPGQSPPR
jgi:hypothetical protein